MESHPLPVKSSAARKVEISKPKMMSQKRRSLGAALLTGSSGFISWLPSFSFELGTEGGVVEDIAVVEWKRGGMYLIIFESKSVMVPC